MGTGGVRRVGRACGRGHVPAPRRVAHPAVGEPARDTVADRDRDLLEERGLAGLAEVGDVPGASG